MRMKKIIQLSLVSSLIAFSLHANPSGFEHGKGKKGVKSKGVEALFTRDSCQYGDCSNGIGASINSHGDIYYGRWYKNKPHGFGTIYFNVDQTGEGIPPGTFLITRFNEGQLDGVSTFDFPGGKKLSVKYKDSGNINAYQELPLVRPQSIRFELPYVYEWEGRIIRRNAYFRDTESRRGVIDIHPYSESNQCMYAYGESKGISIPFLFDTGCSNTSLSAEYIEYLQENGVHLSKKGSDFYETACGLIELNEYVIEELTIGGVTFRNLQVGETKGADNLLGMDVITSFGTFRVIAEEHLLILE